MPSPTPNARIKRVHSFEELVATRWANGINALCWERALPGDFRDIVTALGAGDGVNRLDARRLDRLRLGPAGDTAREVLRLDLDRLQAHGLQPELNCIHGYPRDDGAGPVATDVFSFHADSAPVEADTYLCTYHGSPSEGLRNEEARPSPGPSASATCGASPSTIPGVPCPRASTARPRLSPAHPGCC
jgi:hypothetical protein